MYIYIYIHIYIYIYISSPPNHTDTPENPNAVSRMAQRGRTALDLVLANDKEEAAAVLRAHGAQVSLFFAAEKGMTDEVAARIAAGQDVNACNKEGRTALDVALAEDHEEAAAVLRSHNALEGKQLNERVQKAWRDAGNVVVLDHEASGALYEDYTIVFGNFNTLKADVKLSAAKFYYELEIKHMQGIAQFGWAAEGFESSTESTGEAHEVQVPKTGMVPQTTYKTVTYQYQKPVYELKYRTVKLPMPIEYEEQQIPYQEVRQEVETQKTVYETKYRTVKVPKPIEYEEMQIPYQAVRQEVVTRTVQVPRQTTRMTEEAFSWAFDGVRVVKYANVDAEGSAFGVAWQEGDVLGLACDMVNKSVSFSVNGSFEPPLGLAFQNIAADSIAPAFSADSGFKVVANFGQLPLKHAPPDETYVSVHAAERLHKELKERMHKAWRDEIAAHIAAGQDVNACDQVIFLCVCVCVGVCSC